ncbi:MAG: trypsin-like peptidase domain-containing protein [Candidatus Dependentiae bacterium]
MKPFVSIIVCLIFFNHYIQTQDILNHQELVCQLRQPWRHIQNQVKDCVVQIFAQRAEINICCPWFSPAQQPARGSGFFINDKGELLTNAHVVDQALTIWLQIPSLGKRFINVELIGVCPENDIALLRIAQDEFEMVKEQLGEIPYLQLGDSDTAYRTDEVLALGYPLGQESLKSTTGVISGREQQWIQMDAAINPGSSGGPMLNMHGEVVGINSAGYTEAQNVGYIIPINNVKVILSELYKKKLLHKPFLGVLSINVTDDTTDYLRNPQPGGCFVAEVIKDSPLYNAGVQRGDMIYEINGHRLDIYGEMSVPWSEDKVSIIDYVSRIELGQEVPIIVYRKGERLELTTSFSQSSRLPIDRIYPGHEPLDYEIFGGMVVMELTLNHVHALVNYAPCLARYGEMKNKNEPVLVVTHVFSNSRLYRSRSGINPGSTLVEVNEQPVKTLDDFRQAIKEPVDDTYFVVRAADKVSNITDNLLVVLPYEKLLKDELMLAKNHHYPISDTVKELLQARELISLLP